MSTNQPTSFDSFLAHSCQQLNIDPNAPDAAQQLQEHFNAMLATHQAAQEEDYLQNKDIALLRDYLDQMITHVQGIQTSRAWRIGFALMSGAKKLLKRQSNGDAFDQIESIIERYQHWKKST